MRCTSCGTEVNGQNFCPACGNKIVYQQNPQYVPNQQAQPLPNYGQQRVGVNGTPNQYGQQPVLQQPTQQPIAQQSIPTGSASQQFNNQQAQQQPNYQQQQGYQNPYATQPNQGYIPQQQNPYVYQQQGYTNPPQQQSTTKNGDTNETWKVALSYIPAGFWFGLLDKSKNGKFASNQGLWALICIFVPLIVVWVINVLLLTISYKLYFLTTLLSGAYSLFCFAIGIFCLIGIIKAFQGELIEFPILGKKRIIK